MVENASDVILEQSNEITPDMYHYSKNGELYVFKISDRFIKFHTHILIL